MRISAKAVAVAASIAAVAAISFACGMYVVNMHPAGQRQLPREFLHADSAASNESFAMATGLVDQDVEGLFTLDYFSGELQCVVLNRRTGKFNGQFKTNVTADLGVGQNSKYLLATGRVNSPGRQGGNSVVYVMDTTSGNFAAYGVPWRVDLSSRGQPQTGILALIDVGRARNTPIRGQ
ncbi:MAG: hypothetical protein KDB27_29865 [Planctomycetales bacterium]|nr:hypothetical protein [Planctomycetales bacterium]